MVSVPPSPATLKLKFALSVPLLIPSVRWPQAEAFSFSLAFVFLDAHYTLLCVAPLSMVYPIRHAKWNFRLWAIRPIVRLTP